MSISAGRLRHRVLIQRPEYTQNPVTGEMVKAWVDVAGVYASVEPLSARDFVAAAATQSKVAVRIIIRYRPGVDASMRLLHGTRIYNIEGALPDKDSGLEYLTLPCSEGVSDG